MTISFWCTALALAAVIHVLNKGDMEGFGLIAVFFVVYLYLLECYPTKFRATGLAFCMVIGRIGAFFCPFIHDALIFFNPSTIYFFILMDVVLWVGTTLSCFLPMETKNAPLMTEPTGSEFKGSDFSGCD